MCALLQTQVRRFGDRFDEAEMKLISAMALVSRTWDCNRLPLGPMTVTVQLDEWASRPIYLSIVVIALVGGCEPTCFTGILLPTSGERHVFSQRSQKYLVSHELADAIPP